MKWKIGFSLLFFIFGANQQQPLPQVPSISSAEQNQASEKQNHRVQVINLNLNKKKIEKQVPEILESPVTKQAKHSQQLTSQPDGPQFQIINEKNIPFYCGVNNKTPDLPSYNGVDRQKLVRTNYGFNMYVDANDNIVSKTISSQGTWQHEYITLLGHLVKPGFKVLNLGSQSGLQALVMGKIVGPSGKLFIFEPYSFSNNLVTKNVKLNGLEQITSIYKIGASDAKGTGIINVTYGNTGGSEIGDQVKKFGQYGVFSENQQVELQRTDQILPKDTILDFALIDVERMQIKALKGLKGIIERSPNFVIMTEWQYGRNPKSNKQEALSLINYMVEQGYRIYGYRYKGGCEVGDFKEYQIQQLFKIDFTDLFFFPKNVPLPK